jgi:glycosyltransferase involved in cell wall biosynthesis
MGAPLRTTASPSVIRLLSVLEARTVTAPVRLFLDFCQHAPSLAEGPEPMPEVRSSLTTFCRTHAQAEPNGSMPENEFLASARRANIDVAVIPEAGPFDLRAVAGLCRVVAEQRPDLIETHHVKSHFLMRLSRIPRQRPWIAFHHGYTTPDLKMRLYNQLDRWSLRGADRVITVCAAFARQLARSGVASERIHVVHGALGTAWATARDTDRETLRARLGAAAHERLVLAVGRLSREKGQVDLIDAFRRLHRAHPGLAAKLVIVGEGPERPRIEQAVLRWGMAGRVRLVGQVTDPREYYAAADLFVLPSHSEGCPNVVLEAIAAGVPVIATSAGGVPEILRHGQSALLVEPRQPRALVEAIALLLSDSHLARRLAANAAASSAARRSPAVRARALVEIYREVLRSGVGPGEGLRA